MRPLDLVEKLITGLSAQAIPYCHWKSTTNIEASLRGDTDLDLLVSPECREACLALLDKLEFYQASNSWELDLPGISHFFGYDRPSGRLVHVHLHFQLIVGDDLLKNYRIPVEKVFFNSTINLNHIAVPSPEVEFIIFVLRMVLKRRLLAFFARFLFLMGSVKSLLRQAVGLEAPRLPPGSQAEFDDLKGKISEERLMRALQAGFPFVSTDLFRRCRDSLENTAARFSWLTVGNHLAKALADYRRLTGFAAVGKMLSQGFKLRVRSVLTLLGLRGLTGKAPISGGRIVAVIGDDSAVKKDLKDDLAQWLGSYFSIAELPLRERARHRICRKAARLRRRGFFVLLDVTLFPENRGLSHPGGAESSGHKNEWLKELNADASIMLQPDSPAGEVFSEGAEGQGSNTFRRDNSGGATGAMPHIVDPAKSYPETLCQVRSLVWELLGRELKNL